MAQEPATRKRQNGVRKGAAVDQIRRGRGRNRVNTGGFVAKFHFTEWLWASAKETELRVFFKARGGPKQKEENQYAKGRGKGARSRGQGGDHKGENAVVGPKNMKLFGWSVEREEARWGQDFGVVLGGRENKKPRTEKQETGRGFLPRGLKKKRLCVPGNSNS